MGSILSKHDAESTQLSDQTIAMLVNYVQCTASDVQSWHRRFILLAPDGKLTRRHFEQIYFESYPAINTKSLADLIYGYFDTDKSGYVNFVEFFIPNILCLRYAQSDTQQRAKAIFHIIDSNDDNQISGKEFRKALEALYDFRGLVAQRAEMSAKTKAEQILAMMDYDGNRMISEQEFVYALTRDSDLREILEFDYSTPSKNQ